jgi:Fe-S cluster assembly ATPase SufC
VRNEHAAIAVAELLDNLATCLARRVERAARACARVFSGGDDGKSAMTFSLVFGGDPASLRRDGVDSGLDAKALPTDNRQP